MEVRVTLHGAQRLRALQPWCYRQDVVSHSPEELPRGAVVKVLDPQGNPVGQAFWSHGSPIALRLLTREQVEVDDAFFRQRLERSMARRGGLRGREALRLVHGEADLLPGLFVDRYGQGLVVQALSEGADARKEPWARWLLEMTGCSHAVCRDDSSGRDFEGLPREARPLWGSPPFRFPYMEGHNRFEVDLLADMKTGSFLDQADNHLRAGELGQGEALDCFSYHGGFALALAAGRCTRVVAVEQDKEAAERARANAAANGRSTVEVLTSNAFDVLHGYDREGKRFDTVVIDPPGLAKRREGVQTALRAYRELNLRAFKCLRPEGLLVTCSCSQKVSREAFEEVVLAAARDARRAVQVLERRGAGLDHPVLGTLPETEYLKALFLRVL
ncbi:MAG TPA: class I SAM-dependent rRNA methyltransferase [Myxococcales bacterium]|nr:class I SAM-dependent rRNA methyltransferase [Myxococcales bacterium]